jgi:hypothetical protein
MASWDQIQLMLSGIRVTVVIVVLPLYCKEQCAALHQKFAQRPTASV